MRVGLISVHTSPLAQPGTGDAGGLNVYVDRVARGLAARGVHVDIFTRRPVGDIPSTVHVNDKLAVHHLEAGPYDATKGDLSSYLCAFLLALVDHPAAQRCDLLHGHYWMSGWVGVRAGRQLSELRGTSVPVVQTFHTLGEAKNASLAVGDTPEPPLRLAAERRIAAEADAIIAPTPQEGTFLETQMGAEMVRVVEPGVDLTVFNPDAGRAWAPELLNPAGDAKVVLFVGRLQPLKGPDTAVATLGALHQRAASHRGGESAVLAPQIRLVLVGGPSGTGIGKSDPETLYTQAESLGVEQSLAFLAPRNHEDLAALYHAADVVLMPSHSESFGLVALEAQACGTPVVATDVGGLSYVLGSIDGAAGGGTLVSTYSADAFAEAVWPYLSDEGVVATAARAGVQRAQLFSWDRTVEKSLLVYEELTGKAISGN